MKNTIKMKKWTIFLPVLAALFSCTSEMEPDPGIGIADEGYSEVTFSMQVPGHKVPVAYAATADDENKVMELDILAFAKMNSVLDTLAYRISVAAADIVDASDASDGNKKEIKAKLRRNDADLKLVLVANSKTILDNASLGGGDLLQDVMAKLVYDFDGKWEISPSMRAFPMWGQTNGYISVKNPVVSAPVDVTLLRSVAKVDVGVDVYGDPAIGFGSRFKLSHVYVCNARNGGSIVPDLDDPGLSSNRVTIPNIPAGNAAIASAQDYAVTEALLFNEIYLPESSKTLNDHTCLVIGGEYDGGAETYYRIDFVNANDEKLDLLRNYRFLVNITHVARDGFATVTEALNAKTSHITYTLGVTDENITSIIYNGQYMLGVSESEVSLDWKASTANSIAVATDYPSGWSASSDVSWITVTTASGGTNGAVTYNVSRNLDDSAISRKGTITVTAGSLVQEITVSQYLGANCIVVAPGASVSIPVLFANADGRGRVIESTTLSPEFLWQDANNVVTALNVSGTGKTATLEVTAGSAKGNAVVAVRDNYTGWIVWSWHVWVTDYNYDLIGSQKLHNGTVFMDRNLGATVNANHQDAYGLFYQWGRKDPFPGSAVVNGNTQKTIYTMGGAVTNILVEEVSVEFNLYIAVYNPTTFYTSDEFPWYSWYGLTESNNSLWKDAQGDKTAYDPCPQGWRVPATTGVWSGVSTTGWSYGYTVTPDLGIYPATGSLDFSNGKICDVGAHAYYWSAEPSGVRAKAFHIDASGSSIESSPYRAGGNPVRCVKEY